MAFVSGFVSGSVLGNARSSVRSRVCPIASLSTISLAPISSSPTAVATPTTYLQHERIVAGGFGAPKNVGGKPKRVLMWFHTDLRTEDNEALVKAIENARGPGSAFLPVFVIEKNTSKRTMLAAAELRAELRSLGSDLLVVRGNPTEVLKDLSRKHRMDAIYYNRSTVSDAARTEKLLAKKMKEVSAAFEGFWSNSLFNAETMNKHSITAYAAQLQKLNKQSRTIRRPESVPALPKSVQLTDEIIPKIGAGSSAALKVMSGLKKGSAQQQQDIVLRLKEFLDCGCVSPKTVANEASRRCGNVSGRLAQEMIWRSYMCSVVQGATTAVKQTV